MHPLQLGLHKYIYNEVYMPSCALSNKVKKAWNEIKITLANENVFQYFCFLSFSASLATWEFGRDSVTFLGCN